VTTTTKSIISTTTSTPSIRVSKASSQSFHVLTNHICNHRPLDQEKEKLKKEKETKKEDKREERKKESYLCRGEDRRPSIRRKRGKNENK
jgi:hypothetical protein